MNKRLIIESEGGKNLQAHLCKKMSSEAIRLLEEASARGDLDGVKSIVLENELAYSGKALERASDQGHLAVVKFLLKVIRHNSVVSALELAVTNNHVEVVRILCRQVKDGHLGSAMTIAAERGQLDMIKVMDQLTDTFDMDQAFKSACGFGHLPIVEYLIEEHGMEDMIFAGCGLACTSGHLEIVQYLTHVAGEELRRTPCFTATIEGGHVHILDWLLTLPHERTEFRPLLNRAAILGHLGIVERILEHQPRIEVKIALFNAAERGHLAILEQLYPFLHDATVHKAAFLIACRGGHIPILEFYHQHQWRFDSPIINEGLNKACLFTKHDVIRWLTTHYQINPVSLQFEFGMAAGRVELNPNGALVLAALLDASLEVDGRSYVDGMDFNCLLKVYYTVHLDRQRERLLETSTDLQQVVQAMESTLPSDIIQTKVAKFL
jgi:hypothetical protein